jgi:hypothetical protein
MFDIRTYIHMAKIISFQDWDEDPGNPLITHLFYVPSPSCDGDNSSTYDVGASLVSQSASQPRQHMHSRMKRGTAFIFNFEFECKIKCLGC